MRSKEEGIVMDKLKQHQYVHLLPNMFENEAHVETWGHNRMYIMKFILKHELQGKFSIYGTDAVQFANIEDLTFFNLAYNAEDFSE